ncbi:hypothetical protein CLI74_07610 [Porphyromonas gingivalis]|nr:hypothetical protein A343_1782 [Porphyromonas gingivalis JCVI SC001]ERJ83851.1 hypothetical protein HMPREF1988_00966 [Porphyromonas gingivalis F0185]PDP55945.1 hypothetical protein CLI74_07610 [Porphyromonas gingivalis]
MKIGQKQGSANPIAACPAFHKSPIEWVLYPIVSESFELQRSNDLGLTPELESALISGPKKSDENQTFRTPLETLYPKCIKPLHFRAECTIQPFLARANTA